MNNINRFVYDNVTVATNKATSVWLAISNIACCFFFFFGASEQLYGQSELSKQNQEYVCLPCGSDCDHEVFHEAGTCPHCGMRLVLKKSVVFQNIAPAEVCRIVAARPDVILLDVRTSQEFEGKATEKFGRLKNAINIPVQQLESRLAELESAKQKEIIVYCSHSRRSPRASHILTEHGFTNVKNMTGGMSTWTDSVGNLPMGKALLIK